MNYDGPDRWILSDGDVEVEPSPAPENAGVMLRVATERIRLYDEEPAILARHLQAAFSAAQELRRPRQGAQAPHSHRWHCAPCDLTWNGHVPAWPSVSASCPRCGRLMAEVPAECKDDQA